MRKAIETKWFGPTISKGSRIKATARRAKAGYRVDGSDPYYVPSVPALDLTDAWDYGSGVEENHARVAKLLAAKLGWNGLYIGGATHEGFAFVSLNVGPDTDLQIHLSNLGSLKEDRDWFYLAPQVAK